MKVKDLIELLQKEDQEALVVCSADSEGNRYSPLASFWSGAYRAETTWNGEAGLSCLTKHDHLLGYTEEDVIRGGVPAIILTPIN
jgi:hypothetical protein